MVTGDAPWYKKEKSVTPKYRSQKSSDPSEICRGFEVPSGFGHIFILLSEYKFYSGREYSQCSFQCNAEADRIGYQGF